MMPSQPANFASAEKNPPMCPVATAFFGCPGQSEVTEQRPAHGALVPTSGPQPKMMRFSGSHGLTDAGTSSHITLYAMAVPPQYFLYFVRVSSTVTVRVVRSTRSVLPVKPPVIGITYLLPIGSVFAPGVVRVTSGTGRSTSSWTGPP